MIKNQSIPAPMTNQISSEQPDSPRRITIAEARRKAFEASDKVQQAQVVFAEDEAKRSYDYKVEE